MTPRPGPVSPAPGPGANAHALPATPLVIVTGKGGVGRSTTATAIATLLSQRGKRVALVHPVDAPPVMPPRWAAGGLVVVALDRDHALSNYIGDQLPGPFATALRASRAFKLITSATPGLAELLTIGELRRLSDGTYDHLVFDAPATGHLLALLDAPGRFERAAAVGPIAGRARDLGGWITDPLVSSTVCVTTGDSLAVSEMLDLAQTLEQRMGRPPELVIANRLAPHSPTPAELEQLAAFGDEATAPARASLVGLATRARSERAQLGRLTKYAGSAPARAIETPGAGVEALITALGGVAPAQPSRSPRAERRLGDRRLGDRRTGPGVRP